MKITLEEENIRLREMCKKYLAWLNVTKNIEIALEEDLNNPEMWQTSDNNDCAVPVATQPTPKSAEADFAQS